MLGAGFPICPGYNEPQICSAPGAECLDVAPCESGGCRRIRSVCTSDYYWAPDGGTACGFACEDGPPPTSCAIDELSGVFEGSFIEQSGDCDLGYDPSGPVPLEDGLVADENEPCTVETTKLSPDRCTLTYSLTCELGGGAALWTYSVKQVDEDGWALQGSAKVVLTVATSSCSNSYVVRFDRRP
jgi:hypothetical protein